MEKENVTLIQITGAATKAPSFKGPSKTPKYSLNCPDFTIGDVVEVKLPGYPDVPPRVASVTSNDGVNNFFAIELSPGLWPDGAEAPIEAEVKLHESKDKRDSPGQMTINFWEDPQ